MHACVLGEDLRNQRFACNRKWNFNQASMGSKLAYVMRSTLDYFKLSMHVEITTNLAKLSKKKQKEN